MGVLSQDLGFRASAFGELWFRVECPSVLICARVLPCMHVVEQVCTTK